MGTLLFSNDKKAIKKMYKKYSETQESHHTEMSALYYYDL